jgi:hypothetical protein
MADSTSAGPEYDFFIAHASEDKEPARELHDALEAKGHRVFLDQERQDLELGDDWHRVIDVALASARVCVALVTSNTADAQVQRAEILRSLDQQRDDPQRHRLVPVVIGDKIAYGLETVNALFADELGGLPGVAEELDEMLERLTADGEGSIDERSVVVDMSHQQEEWNRWSRALDALELSDRLHRPGSLERQESLAGATTLVLPLPFHRELSRSASETLEAWVEDGGGLLLLGYYAADLHHESNPSRLAGVFGLGFGGDLLLPAGSAATDARRQVWGDTRHAVTVPIEDLGTHPLLDGVRSVALQSSCTIEVHDQSAEGLFLRAPDDAELWIPEGNRDHDGYLRIIVEYHRAEADAPIWLAALPYGKGRVVAIGSWKVFTVDEADNRKLVTNVLEWLGAGPTPSRG